MCMILGAQVSVFFRMAAGGEFLSGEEFDLYFDNLAFIAPDDDEELSAAFAEAVDEVCITNSALKKPKPLRLCAWKMTFQLLYSFSFLLKYTSSIALEIRKQSFFLPMIFTKDVHSSLLFLFSICKNLHKTQITVRITGI